jgi:hypothetical protein
MMTSNDEVHICDLASLYAPNASSDVMKSMKLILSTRRSASLAGSSQHTCYSRKERKDTTKDASDMKADAQVRQKKTGQVICDALMTSHIPAQPEE